MITLAAFYKKLNLEKESTEVKEATADFDYYDAILCLRETFLKFNPKHNFIVTTDNFTQLPLPIKEINRMDIDHCNLMEAIVKRDSIITKTLTGNLMLVGADHLINSSVEKLFEGEFDIGILFNGDNVNNTVVLMKIKESNREKIIKFFEAREQEYYKLNEKDFLWFGDQLSIDLTLSLYGVKDQYQNQFATGNGIIFKFLHYGENEICGTGKSKPKFNKNAVMIDFKGIRKQWFKDIFQLILHAKKLK